MSVVPALRIEDEDDAFVGNGGALIDCAENPVPEGTQQGFVTTSDGIRLRFAQWTATGRPIKGTVLLLQGRAEFIEKYFETVGDLRSRGFDVVAFDWRGQGGSDRLTNDRMKGYVADFGQYVTDLDAIMNDIMLPDCRGPYYILGHSMGGLVALLAAPALGNRIRRMVLSSPLLQLHTIPMKQELLQKVFAFITFAGFGRLSADRRTPPLHQRSFDNNKLTSDQKRFECSQATLGVDPSLSIAGPTVSWVFAACNAMEQVNDPEYSAAISIPTLLVAAGNDEVVESNMIESFGQRMRSGSSLRISGAKHEILLESDVFREPFLAAFDAFVPGDAS